MIQSEGLHSAKLEVMPVRPQDFQRDNFDSLLFQVSRLEK